MDFKANKPKGYFPGEEDDQDNADSPLYQAIKEYISEHYQPTTDYPEAVKLTTNELFEKIYNLFPAEWLTRESLAEWMYGHGFRFYDEGGLRMVWLLGRV